MPEENDHEHNNSQEMGSFEELVIKASDQSLAA
jgi:hypothetical protein